MDQIAFRSGNMLSFTATRKFALGSTGLEATAGQEILFDGTSAEVGGNRFTLPQLRGAIRANWMVPSDTYDEDEDQGPRVTAGIQVRAAVNTGNNTMAPVAKSPITTVESDEREVMTTRGRTAAAQQATQQARAHQGRQGGIARQTGGGNGTDIGGAEMGVAVPRTFLTSAKSASSVTPDSVGSAIYAANAVKVQPGQGTTEEEYLSRMSAQEQDEYHAKKEAAKAGVASRINPNYSGPAVTQVHQAPAPRTVGKVKTAKKVTESEGITTTSSVGGGTEIFDPSGTGGKATHSVVESEGIRFGNTNGPKRAFQPTVVAEEPQVSKIEKDGTAEARKRIAKMMCTDFPEDYNFSDHWKRRLAMIRLNYEHRADVIKAIFAAESDDFKKVLFEEFPDVFA